MHYALKSESICSTSSNIHRGAQSHAYYDCVNAIEVGLLNISAVC